MSTTAKDLLTPTEVITPQPEVLTAETIGGLTITKPASEGYVNLLLYGESGTTKTRTSGSACVVPEMSPVLLIDFEGGTLSLAGDYGDVQVVRAKTWAAVDKLYGDLYNKNPYKTIVLDSLTETQKFCMGDLMKEVVRKDSERDRDVPSVREWGKSGEQIRRLVRALRDLPCNTIITALTREETNDSGVVIKIRPGLPGQLKNELAGYMDIVGYMYKKEKRVGPGEPISQILMLTQGTEKVVAKDRSGTLPAIMEAPTMAEIFALVNGRKTIQ